MKVRIQQRSIYHKFAEVEIYVDPVAYEHWKLDNGKYASLEEFLNENEDLYVDKIDKAMSDATYEFGFGTDSDANSHYNSCMDEPDSESEWRYECDELKTGGHL